MQKKTIIQINNNTSFDKIMKQTEYKLIETRKTELERELKDL